eukprot:TRINITY_DN3198_c0_g1_i7.p1 TRINITY_DN3198_c0_g1~~TRINITY_DN3198_c0_g1_i7.p1  ORF type:complete len:227 (-),score=39.69 TRINITY_DN3198_c0_g1_i7:318-998(-)
MLRHELVVEKLDYLLANDLLPHSMRVKFPAVYAPEPSRDAELKSWGKALFNQSLGDIAQALVDSWKAAGLAAYEGSKNFKQRLTEHLDLLRKKHERSSGAGEVRKFHDAEFFDTESTDEMFSNVQEIIDSTTKKAKMWGNTCRDDLDFRLGELKKKKAVNEAGEELAGTLTTTETIVQIVDKSLREKFRNTTLLITPLLLSKCSSSFSTFLPLCCIPLEFWSRQRI